MIGGIVNTQIADKWCERDGELEHMFALVRKRSEHIETKKQGKKYVRQIGFNIVRIQQILLQAV